MANDARNEKQHASGKSSPSGSTLMGFLLGIGFSLVIAAIIAYFIYSTGTPFKLEKNPNPPTASLPQAKAPEPAKGSATSAQGKVTPPTSTPAKAAPEPATPIPATAPQPVSAPAPSVAANVALPEPVKPAPAPVATAAAPTTKTASASAEENKPLFLQAGAFTNKVDAESRRAMLALAGLENVKITEIMKDDKPLYRVRVGPFSSPESASQARGDMARNGIDSVLIK